MFSQSEPSCSQNLSKYVEFANVFSRLQSILLTSSVTEGVYNLDLEEAINWRVIRDTALFMFWKPDLTQAENDHMAGFIATQRTLAGFDQCCESCRDAQVFCYTDRRRFLEVSDTATRNLAEKMLLVSKVKSKTDLQIRTTCSRRVRITSAKSLEYIFKDAVIEIDLAPSSESLRIKASSLASPYQNMKQYRTKQFPLPQTWKGFDYTRAYIEMVVVFYLREIGLVGVLCDELMDEVATMYLKEMNPWWKQLRLWEAACKIGGKKRKRENELVEQVDLQTLAQETRQ